MYEAFSHINEGIVYGVVREIKKDKILIEAGGERKYYDIETVFTGISEGDYVRLFVKDGKIFFIEKLDKDSYENFRKIIDELSRIK